MTETVQPYTSENLNRVAERYSADLLRRVAAGLDTPFARDLRAVADEYDRLLATAQAGIEDREAHRLLLVAEFEGWDIMRVGNDWKSILGALRQAEEEAVKGRTAPTGRRAPNGETE